MTRRSTTSYEERLVLVQQKEAGASLRQIAQQVGLSWSWARKWWRRYRKAGKAGLTSGPPTSRGPLSRFAPRVRYVALRLRREHPGWGPGVVLEAMRDRPSLGGYALPSAPSLWRYYQRFGGRILRPKVRRRVPGQPKPSAPQEVHQRWQLDLQQKIPTHPQRITVLNIRDEVGRATVGSFVHPAGAGGRLSLEEIRTDLRQTFPRWGFPDALQTDHDTVVVGHPHQLFPSPFTLWLVGLGIEHHLITPGRPRENGTVERFHRTWDGLVLSPDVQGTPSFWQARSTKMVTWANERLPSRAKGCHGQPPLKAHPELRHPRRSYHPSRELALFDLKRVDAYLSQWTWPRLVGKTGQVYLSDRAYAVGRAYRGQTIEVTYDPHDRHFVFRTLEGHLLRRTPAKGLTVEALTGLEHHPQALPPQQLELPLSPRKVA